MYCQTENEEWLLCDNWFIEMTQIEQNKISCSGYVKDFIKEGFYSLKLDLKNTILGRTKGFTLKGQGFFQTSSRIWSLVSNHSLIDSDYDLSEVSVGLYNTYDLTCDENIKFEFVWYVGNFSIDVRWDDHLKRMAIANHNLFKTPLYDFNKLNRGIGLVGLWKSSIGSNGIDFVFNNLEGLKIAPKGNLIIPWRECFGDINNLPGYFLLRSSFIRKGLSLVVNVKERYFWIMNNSFKNSVELKSRVIQYCSLGSLVLFNENLESSNTNSIYTKWSTKDKYSLTFINKDRQSKWKKF